MKTTTGAYEIWCSAPDYDEQHETRLVAAFRFMPEALDYVAYSTSKGVPVILRKPGAYASSPVTVSEYAGEPNR